MGKRRNGKWLLAALLAVSLLFGGATALAAPEGTGSGTPSNVISVGGSATVTLQPDVAYVTTGVNSVNRDLAAARRDNNDRMAKVLTQLSKQGIEDKDIKTTDYSINARSTTSSNPAVATISPSHWPVPVRTFVENSRIGRSNMVFAKSAPPAAPASWNAMYAGNRALGSSPRAAMTALTTGFMCAPLIGPNTSMRT